MNILKIDERGWSREVSENKVHDGVADIYSLIPGSVPNEYGYLNYIGKNTGPLTFDYSGLAFPYTLPKPSACLFAAVICV